VLDKAPQQQQSSTLTPQQVDQLLKLLPQSTACNSGSKFSSETDEELDVNFAGNVVLSSAVSCKHDWILDTGATDHIAMDISQFTDLRKFSSYGYVTLPDAHTAEIVGIGDIVLTNGIVLKNTLCVPKFKYNLLSISRLAKDNHIRVVFYDTFCLLQDYASSQVKGIGKEFKGLYYLLNLSKSAIQQYMVQFLGTTASSQSDHSMCSDIQSVQTKAYATAVSVFQNKANLWHHRLGHIPFSRLSYVPGLNVHTSSMDPTICVTCPLAKHTHLPFSLNEKSCDIPFGLIHMDIWGPYRVCTQNQCRYFLTIVDDCTRATWTYLLKYKSQAFATMTMFYNYALTQFGYTIKIVRSDNALEFDTSECQQFFATKGIVHQTSCVDKPQQNGRVERKHRHLLEISRALRFHAHLPLKFWGDCVLTATYIINRLPSKVLQNVTPYEKLLHKKPTYQHMKVFGCLAFASNPSRTGDKLQPRGIPCVFLGYPATQKGYKLLNLLTELTFVSRDVVFHEHIFPFQQFSFQQYKNPLPAYFPQHPPSVDLSHEDDGIVPLTEPEQSSAQPDSAIPSTSTPAAELSGSSSSAPPPQQVRTSTRISKRPEWLQDYITMTAVQTSFSDALTYESICPEYSAYLSVTARSGDPGSFDIAVQDTHWCTAMNMELKALEQNRTWILTESHRL